MVLSQLPRMLHAVSGGNGGEERIEYGHGRWDKRARTGKQPEAA